MRNGIYDIESGTIIVFDLSNAIDERKLFQNHLIFINKNDILIFDRGYYSKLMIQIILEKEAHCIIRLKTNLSFVQDMTKNNFKDNIYRLDNNCKLWIVKYTIKNNDYFLGTTLLDSKKYSILSLKELYGTRWDIDESYKCIKIPLNGNNIRSQNENKIFSEIYIRLIILLIVKYIENINKPVSVRNNYKKKINSLLPLLLFKNKNISKMLKCVHIILGTACEYELNRHYERIAIKPGSKWYHYNTLHRAT